MKMVTHDRSQKSLASITSARSLFGKGKEFTERIKSSRMQLKVTPQNTHEQLTQNSRAGQRYDNMQLTDL